MPGEAVPLAAKVSLLVPVVLAGMKEAFTPPGKPDAVRVTLPLKPFCGVTVSVVAPLEPCAKLRLVGAADSVKLGGAFTVRVSEVVLVRLPEVPETVMVAVPSVAELPAVSVRVLVVVVLEGTKEAVTPVGRPDADKLTIPEKFPMGTTVTVVETLAPCATVRLPEAAVKLKPEMGVTPGQLLTRLVALMVPMPVAKSHPVVVP